MSSASLWTVDVATIDRARILRGWTRRALGREAHVDEGTLCDLFAGRRRSNFGTLRAICLALGLSLQDVIRFGDDRNAERGWARLPDWLNPWWSDVRQIRSPLDQQTARNSILDASGFLKGALGRNLLGKTLTVFRESWWHLRRPWVIARVTVAPASPGSLVSLRLGRSLFQAAIITFFVIFALGGPLVFLGFAIAAVVGGHHEPPPWWVYPAWEAQDAAIYAACMALNSAAVRRDSAWLVQRITDLVSGIVVADSGDARSSERSDDV